MSFLASFMSACFCAAWPLTFPSVDIRTTLTKVSSAVL